MPSLNWIGKEKIVNHDKEVSFRLLKKNKKYSLGQSPAGKQASNGASENLILEGDNLEALKALMPFYYGKIKCIYIDPPYNTGNEKWVYNDKVNSPKIKEWLGKVVGPDGDDLCRHDKWLCMMYPRLKLLYDLLRDDGAIFISIDDNEQHRLRFVLDEIFNPKNFVGKFIWRKKEGGGQADDYFVTEHEYVYVYQKTSKFEWMDEIIPVIEAEFNKKDKGGKFTAVKLAKWGNTARRQDRPKMYFPIKTPDNKNICPIAPDGGDGRWRVGKKRMSELISKKLIFWQKKNKQWIPYEKIYFAEGDVKTIKERSILYEVATTADASKVLTNIFGKKDIFDNPKPSDLIKFFINYTTTPDSIILDSFAGSGTTAHAVLDLNKEDGGNRKFILVEMEKNIAKNITAERVKRVARGYSYKKNGGQAVKVAGLGGGFEYVELGEPLFDKDGMINKAVSFEDMARYVYFTETRTNLEKKNIKENYLGEFGGNHYFLLFDGIGKNVLNRKFLKELKRKDGRKIIYADKYLLDEEVLEKYQIIFKQIPYQVKIY